MKKLFVLTIATVITATAAIAQPTMVSKGNWFLNAGVGNLFSTGAELPGMTAANINFTDGFRFDATGRGGYFLMDKLALEGVVGLGFGDNYTHFALDAGVRYFFFDLGKGGFFADGLIGISTNKGQDAAFALTLDAGYAWFIKENISLEPMAQFWIPFSDGYDFNFSIGAGFSIYF